MRPTNCTTACCAALFSIALGAFGCSSSTPEAEINSGPALTTTTTGSGGTGMVMPMQGPAEPVSTIPDSPLAIDPGEEPAEMECATSETPTSLQQVALAFVFDVSASMGSGARPQDDKTLKWDPVVLATKEFFADASSQGLSATLTFFPNELASLTGDMGGFGATGGPSCDVAGYAETDVPLTALPSDAFALAIDAVTPPDENSWRLGTPTLPAVEGTIQAIDAMRAANPNTRFAIVLVTDGIPALCFTGAEDSVTDVAAAVQTVAADTPTYVIGVQSPEEASLDALNEVAYAGGTGTAFLVDTADPVQTKEDLKAVIETIRESTFSCNIDIPPPPGGEMFDKNKVNVSFTTELGAQVEYTYDPTCAAPDSWRYDNETTPTIIEVCPGSCDSIKATVESGQLNIEFGCQTRIY